MNKNDLFKRPLSLSNQLVWIDIETGGLGRDESSVFVGIQEAIRQMNSLPAGRLQVVDHVALLRQQDRDRQRRMFEAQVAQMAQMYNQPFLWAAEQQEPRCPISDALDIVRGGEAMSYLAVRKVRFGRHKELFERPLKF